MNIIFDESASDEYNDAIEYYELQISGLGKRFTKEIKYVSVGPKRSQTIII